MLFAAGIAAWLIVFIFALRGARWAYAIFVIPAFVWIPARTRFHLHTPSCPMRFTADLVLGSIVKYKHITLWAAFFLMTWVQFRGRRHAMIIAAIATMFVGILIEIEEGATGTGNCRATDMLPDAIGALIGATIVTVRGRLTAPAQRPPYR